MNLLLKRQNYEDNGIFGRLMSLDREISIFTLEHAYDMGLGNGSYSPKIPTGTYTCVRGMHRLSHMAHDFETFEITDVPGHTGILFHTGNTNNDSSGCVLLGSDCNQIQGMLLQSRKAFDFFMSLQLGLNEFELTIL